MRKASITLLALACFGSSAFGASPISALEAQVAALRAEVKSLQTQLTVIQQNNALKLGPFVTVDPNPENNVIGPNIVFKGANIHIESGSGATDDNGTLLSLGNLFIGYNEPSQASLNIPPNGPRMGSHNVIVGRHNIFNNAFGVLVAGENNYIRGEAQSIVGGTGNSIRASNEDGSTNALSVIVGGFENLTEANRCVVVGGRENVATGVESVALGGFTCLVTGNNAVTLGGNDARVVEASGPFSVTSFIPITVVQP